MYETLFHQLHSYICENNPEMVLSLEADFSLRTYLEEKVKSVEGMAAQLLKEEAAPHSIVERCIQEMTAELRPSKFLYLRQLLQEEFHGDYLQMRENGTLTYETIKLVKELALLFEAQPLSEDKEANKFLRKSLMTGIRKYLLTAKTIGS